jgi:CheY-like chemotaxis protein
MCGRNEMAIRCGLRSAWRESDIQILEADGLTWEVNVSLRTAVCTPGPGGALVPPGSTVCRKVIRRNGAEDTEDIGGCNPMSSLKLLVVEDDAPSLELMQEVLASLKAQVVPIGDGQNAASLVNRERFDGIFLDLEMPNMHGFDLTRHIRGSSWNRATPIVIVTGRDERSTMQQAFAIGANFFLQKPVDRRRLTTLFRAVRGVMLENRRRHVRVPLRTDVVCNSGSTSVRGMTWNLSQGGVLIDSGPTLKAGDVVRLSFRLPMTGDQIDGTGIVVWVSENRQGIRFTQLNPHSSSAIKDFIAEVEQPE